LERSLVKQFNELEERWPILLVRNLYHLYVLHLLEIDIPSIWIILIKIVCYLNIQYFISQVFYFPQNKQFQIFFLEHAGELRIIVLIEERESYIDPHHTHTHPNTMNPIDHRLIQVTRRPNYGLLGWPSSREQGDSLSSSQTPPLSLFPSQSQN
jgi:hypothetical protein